MRFGVRCVGQGASSGVSIARSLKRTAIALGLKTIEALLAAFRSLRWVGVQIASGVSALGRGCACFAIPIYRLWWSYRRSSAALRRRGLAWIVAICTSRTTVYATFIAVVLVIAAQSIHAREYGGFIGERPLLREFITSEVAEEYEDVVAGPATRIAEPTFRAASVRAHFTPTVLGASVSLAAPPPTSGFAIVQPVLTDSAVAASGRKGVTVYAVEEGDTTSSIAERFGIRTSTILWANNLASWSVIRPGQAIRILPTDGVVHTVARGDTLEKIATKYQADAEETLEFNRLVDADDLTIGDSIIVPGGHPPVVAAPRVATAVAKAPPQPLPSIPGKLFWPSVSAYRISQYFSWRHHGIDIAASHGTPVFASDPGVVVSSGWISGYGYQVTIDHGNGLETRYAHSSKLLVSKGQTVERGQQIALVGSTGRSTGPHIHFEVFARGTRVNPFTYLR